MRRIFGYSTLAKQHDQIATTFDYKLAVVTKEISQTPSCKSASQFVPTMFSRFWLHVILKYDYLFSLLRIFEGETLCPKIACREKGLS